MDNTSDQVAFGAVACGVCQTREAVWVHTLDPQLARFRVFSKEHMWGSPISVCNKCEQLLQAADVEALVVADPTSGTLAGDDLDELVRNGLQALVAADLGATRVDASQSPRYQRLVSEGFSPLENITGAVFLGDAWPESDRRELPSVSAEGVLGMPADRHWFVRSPWPSVPLNDVFGLVISTLEESLNQMAPRYEEEQVKADVRVLFKSSEEEIRRKLGT